MIFHQSRFCCEFWFYGVLYYFFMPVTHIHETCTSELVHVSSACVMLFAPVFLLYKFPCDYSCEVWLVGCVFGWYRLNCHYSVVKVSCDVWDSIHSSFYARKLCKFFVQISWACVMSIRLIYDTMRVWRWGFNMRLKTGRAYESNFMLPDCSAHCGIV